MPEAMTRDELTDFIGEGFHTALRKAADSPEADKAWTAINDMDPEEWSDVLHFVADPLLAAIKTRGVA